MSTNDVDDLSPPLLSERCHSDVAGSVRQLSVPCDANQLSMAIHKLLLQAASNYGRSLRGSRQYADVLSGDLRALVGDLKRDASSEDIARAVCKRERQWQLAIRELLQRLAKDWPLLVDHFKIASQVYLTGISGPLSDPHNGGRSVHRLTFSNGTELIYKPRPIDPELTFGRLLYWLAQEGCTPRLSHCLMLGREGYGWSEHVPTTLCKDLSQARRYYERQGAFLALFYILRGGDLNAENVVVNGENPVWVDTECVCGPEVERIETAPTVPVWMSDSVLSTRMFFSPGQARLAPRRFVGIRVSCLANDQTLFGPGDVLTPPCRNSLLEGFRAVYVWLLSNRSRLIAEDGPFRWWRGCKVRVILAPTRLYAELADALLLAPRDLKADVRQMVAQALQGRLPSARWRSALILADLRALEEGDVPLWQVSTLGRHLREASGAIARDVARRTGWEHLLQRTEAMSINDLERQAWLIDTFLTVRGAEVG